MEYDLIYTNSYGDSIDFSAGQGIHLARFEGFGEVGASVQMQKSPYQDGSTHVATQLEVRTPYIEFFIQGNNWNEVSELRRQVAKVFNPKMGGTFTLIQGGNSYSIYAIPEHVPVFPDSQATTLQRVSLDFICPSPFWQDVNPINIKLEDFVPNFKFPFSFPVIFSIRGDTKILTNSGHVSTPVTVTFRGEAVNPKITNLETGEFIKVNRTIPIGYSLVITTEFNNKSVKIIAPDGTETNAMGYIDLDSSFFSLDVGDNRLSFITDGGNPEVYVEYRNLYVGV